MSRVHPKRVFADDRMVKFLEGYNEHLKLEALNRMYTSGEVVRGHPELAASVVFPVCVLGKQDPPCLRGCATEPVLCPVCMDASFHRFVGGPRVPKMVAYSHYVGAEASYQYLEKYCSLGAQSGLQPPEDTCPEAQGYRVGRWDLPDDERDMELAARRLVEEDEPELEATDLNWDGGRPY